MNLTESAKYTLYRTPLLQRLMAPKYPYKVDPGELSAMIGLIESSRAAGGAIAEVGVAKGDTSLFLLEHLKSVGDPRTLMLFDTFAGFTQDSIDVEVGERGKPVEYFDKFRYGDEIRFRRHLSRAGYSRFETVKGDAARYDWQRLGPLGAMLLDVDLYAPTLAILEQVFPLLVEGGGIVVDDCVENGAWDGSLQAYEEFTTAHGLPFARVGSKGGIIRRT
jgi:O-methyltransferase